MAAVEGLLVRELVLWGYLFPLWASYPLPAEP